MTAAQSLIREQAEQVRDALALDPRAYSRGIGPLDELVLLALELADESRQQTWAVGVDTGRPRQSLLGLIGKAPA